MFCWMGFGMQVITPMACINIYIHIYIYIYIDIRTYIYIYIYICTCVNVVIVWSLYMSTYTCVGSMIWNRLDSWNWFQVTCTLTANTISKCMAPTSTSKPHEVRIHPAHLYIYIYIYIYVIQCCDHVSTSPYLHIVTWNRLDMSSWFQIEIILKFRMIWKCSTASTCGHIRIPVLIWIQIDFQVHINYHSESDQHFKCVSQCEQIILGFPEWFHLDINLWVLVYVKNTTISNDISMWFQVEINLQLQGDFKYRR